MTNDVPELTLSPEQHRMLGTELFNFTWTLIEKPDRTTAEIDAMIHAAHASRHHWSLAAGSTPANAARGEWLCSRVYAVLGHAEAATWHASRCLKICEENGIRDWDIAFAYEALARARSVARDYPERDEWLAKAREAAGHIDEAEERDLLLADLETV